MSKPQVFGKNLVGFFYFFHPCVSRPARLNVPKSRLLGHGKLKISFVQSAFRKCLLLQKHLTQQHSLTESTVCLLEQLDHIEKEFQRISRSDRFNGVTKEVPSVRCGERLREIPVDVRD